VFVRYRTTPLFDEIGYFQVIFNIASDFMGRKHNKIMEQELFTLQDDMRSPQVFARDRIT